jgi:hypothetical protein
MEQGEPVEKTLVERECLEEKLDSLYTACATGETDRADTIASELKTICYNEQTDAVLKEIIAHVASLDYDILLKKITTLKGALV